MEEKSKNISLDNLIDINPLLKDSLMNLAKDEELASIETQKILKRFEDLVNDENSEFDLRHAIIALNRSLQYVVSGIFDNIESFHEEITKANELIDTNIEAILGDKEENKTDARLLLSAAALIDFVLLRNIYNTRR